MAKSITINSTQLAKNLRLYLEAATDGDRAVIITHYRRPRCALIPAAWLARLTADPPPVARPAVPEAADETP